MNPASLTMLIAVMALSGCSVGGIGAPQVVGTLKLGADLPLSGDDAPDGLPVKNAIELAISQAGLVCGATNHRDACVRLEAVIDQSVDRAKVA